MTIIVLTAALAATLVASAVRRPVARAAVIMARGAVVMGVARIRRSRTGSRAIVGRMGPVAGPASIRRVEIGQIGMTGLSATVLLLPENRPFSGRSHGGRKNHSEQRPQEGHACQDRQTEFDTFFHHGTLVEQAWCQSHGKLPSGLMRGRRPCRGLAPVPDRNLGCFISGKAEILGK